MLTSVEFNDTLCQSYSKVIKELDDKLNALQSEPENDSRILKQEKIFQEFYANHLMPKEYWQFYERFGYNHIFEDSNKREKRRFNAHWHFYFTGNLGPPKDTKNYNTDEPEYLFPHSNLKECHQKYEMNSSSPLPKDLIKKYDKMIQLYPQIKASEDNVEEWCKYILEAGNINFIILKLEHRLGQNLSNKELWKTYIKFLETCDTNRMLQTYSKYCRFFLDDSEMKEEYREKVEKYGQIFVPWNNAFEFENKSNDDTVKSNESQKISQMINNDIPKSQPLNKNIFEDFYQTYENQVFPFQKPFIEYILENANSAAMTKLYQTCKFFFAKKRAPICYKLEIEGRNSSFNKESLKLSICENEKAYLKSTWISTTFLCHSNCFLDKKYASRIICRLYQCDAKYITILSQMLTFNELKFLIGSGNVVNLNLKFTWIMHNKNECVNLEEITEFLPNIEELQLSNVKVNKNTANVLEKQNFNSKIVFLKLWHIFGQPFNTNEFLKFFMKNSDEHIFLIMEFMPNQPEFTNDFLTNFKKLMKDANVLKENHIEIHFIQM